MIFSDLLGALKKLKKDFERWQTMENSLELWSTYSTMPKPRYDFNL